MLVSVPQLKLLAANKPSIRPFQSLMKAAVAIILRDREQATEFLIMQRAAHEQDPWSGQMSFPGGKIERGENAKAAAMREVQEEVGIALCETEYVGRLDDLYGINASGDFNVHVACFVFKSDRELQLSANYEVADMLWLPIKFLNDPANAHSFYHPKHAEAKMPALMIDQRKQQVLWGMSLRMLVTLCELLNWPMSALSEQDQKFLKNIENRITEQNRGREVS